MSGGSYDYLFHRIEETAERTTAILKLFKEIAHDIEWADSADYCKGCTDLRVLAALRRFMEDGAMETEQAIGALGNRSIQCQKCRERERSTAAYQEAVRLSPGVVRLIVSVMDGEKVRQILNVGVDAIKPHVAHNPSGWIVDIDSELSVALIAKGVNRHG